MSNDLVQISCYGTTAVLPRREALSLYAEAMAASEGHEHLRYSHIHECLLAGDKVITDEEV